MFVDRPKVEKADWIAKKVESSRKCSTFSSLRDGCVSFDFPLRFPYRYSSTCGELIAVEPAVHHNTAERRDERGIVLTGDLQDVLQVTHDDDFDDNGGSGDVRLQRLAF